MQPGTQKILRFLQSWIINTIAVMLAVIILRGHISYGDRWQNLLIASFLLGILNAVVRITLRPIRKTAASGDDGYIGIVIANIIAYLLQAARDSEIGD